MWETEIAKYAIKCHNRNEIWRRVDKDGSLEAHQPARSQGGRYGTESVSWVLRVPPTSEQAADQRPKNAFARTAVDGVAPLKAGLLNDLENREQNPPVLDEARHAASRPHRSWARRLHMRKICWAILHGLIKLRTHILATHKGTKKPMLSRKSCSEEIMVAHCEVKPGIRSAAGTLDMTEVMKLRVEHYALRDLNRRRWGAFDYTTEDGTIIPKASEICFPFAIEFNGVQLIHMFVREFDSLDPPAESSIWQTLNELGTLLFEARWKRDRCCD
ncbi:hypothetical protein DFH08DRAFT_807356 [Mycena albidolilacea]|uniref:Uncharacterized protein n=1 Tax=Mycena albidolilacea TaxID=1033008 RepID=A0AAD7A5N9_9AGAR|nr:hypothetical protein DFH08DRAFT_807356 [Mycena albidolilacea]